MPRIKASSPAIVRKPVTKERQDELIAEFNRRQDHVAQSYRFARQHYDPQRLNESLATLVKSLNPRARRKAQRERLHPMLELLITERFRSKHRVAGEAIPIPTPEDIYEAAKEVAALLKPKRGRPADAVLTHHVQGLMALWQQFTSSPVLAAQTKNSVYDPQMTSPGGRMIERFFEKVDPSITATALTNVVRHARATGAIEGKSFMDFFPFYGGRIDPETGMPVPGRGMKLISFEPSHPIYCS